MQKEELNKSLLIRVTEDVFYALGEIANAQRMSRNSFILRELEKIVEDYDKSYPTRPILRLERD